METLLTIDEVADRLNVQTGRVQRWVTSGQLSCVRVGTRMCFRQRDLDEFVQLLTPGKEQG
jgi:excisionase family DNA binding protein